VAGTRRLAAIMFTDTVGYTASTQADEGRTLELLRQQSELIRPLIAVHQGREIKSTGDGWLVEFDSALKATQCAVNIQRRIREHNAEGGQAPIQIRIGIHLGDVVQEGHDILGDAVNIAARIEPVAEPGGICVSGAVREQVWNKIPDRLEKLPPAGLKGVRVPTDVYRVVLPPSAGPEEAPALNRLAVLPFSSISPDSRDEYVADGLTEEMITVLSRLQGLRVIARTSVLPYKATPKPISQVGSELAVSSVLEGSVRRAGNRIRITVQLIDVATQEHTWANTYDRELNDVFALQDEIAREVADALKVTLGSAEEARMGARPAPGAESYLAYLKGRSLLHQSAGPAPKGTGEGFVRHDEASPALESAKAEFERAIALDPTNAAAYSGLADATYVLMDEQGGARGTGEQSPAYWLRERERTIDACETLARKALELDPDLAEAHASLGSLYMRQSERSPDAEGELRRAIALSPSYAAAHSWLAELLFLENRTDAALEQLTLAEDADPLSAASRVNLAMYLIGITPGHSWNLPKGYLGIYYALNGRAEKARELLAEVERMPEEVRGRAQVLAVIYGYLHEPDRCFPWMEKALARRETSAEWWRTAPRLEQLRGDHRFVQLMANVE
jgi:adenylate cyclase